MVVARGCGDLGMVVTADHMLRSVWPLHVQTYLLSATRQEGAGFGEQADDRFWSANRGSWDNRGDRQGEESSLNPKPKAKHDGKPQEKSKADEGGQNGHRAGYGSQGMACPPRHAENEYRGVPSSTYLGRGISSSKRRLSVGRMSDVRGNSSISWWPSGEMKTVGWAERSLKKLLVGEGRSQELPHFGNKEWKPVEVGDRNERLQVVHQGSRAQEDEEVEAKANDRGSMRRALMVAEEENQLRSALDKLKEGFWAASTAKARSSKRREVMELAAKVTEEGLEVLPLTRDRIEKVAAALKASGMKSGDQYLNELKLWHVEEGHPVAPWMVRLMGLCKKSIARGKGPARRAKEFQVEDLTQEKWTSKPRDETMCNSPAQAYAWACVWMLRCVELCDCRWENVHIDMDKSEVRLFLPKSKTDQTAGGVSRTLRCCGRAPCSFFCAFGIANGLKLKRGFELCQAGPMWISDRGNPIAKAQMIMSWRWLWGRGISGHSARRSGAMKYVRLGMPIQELAFLGRWKSAVVLTYAEEALQTHPANEGISEKTPRVRAAKPKAKSKSGMASEGNPQLVTRKPSTMWVAANGYRSRERVWHRVAAAGWNIPMHKWMTACGWNFTERSANVSLAHSLPLLTKKCKKCGEARSACDDVKEGRNLAGLMCQEMTSSLTDQSIVLD